MDEQMRNVNLSVDEINECLEKLIEDHGGEHFEPECPACTAFKKLAAALSQPAAQVDSSHPAGGECGGVQVPSITVADLDALFSLEIERVSSIPYDSNEICRWFYKNLRAAIPGAPKATP